MSVNVFTASGRCGSDMEVRVTPAGKAIGSFNIPVETGFGDNKKTAWVTCKMFNERAEKLAQYIKKGSLVTVTGAFQLDEWEKDGVKHSRPVILVNDIQLPPMQQGDAQQQRQQPQQASQAQQQRQQSAPVYNEPPIAFDDDIPFAPIGLQYPAILNCM